MNDRIRMALSVLVIASLLPVPVTGQSLRKNPTCRYIQRTMKSLASSTAENPSRVRMLFYGQSIVAQGWHDRILAGLRKRYPTAVIECRNPAIGGFTSPDLCRTAYADVYPYYPDILFFHVYGPLDKYEEIVRTTREKTTAEIVLWSSHMAEKDDPVAMLAVRDSRTRGIEDIARRYRCMYVDLNRKWAKHLVEKGLKPKDLLRDSIHLSDESGALDLYAGFIAEELVFEKETDADWGSGRIETFAANDPRVRRFEDGAVEIAFVGTRLVGVVAGAGEARTFLDGRPTESCAEMWSATRVTGAPLWMPAVKRIQWKTCPVAEEWAMTFLPDSDPDGDPLRFSISGSVSGTVGRGDTTSDFLSPDGRVFIEREDFNNGQYRQFGKKVEPGRKVYWQTKPAFSMPCRADSAGMRLVLAQGCRPGLHVLRVVPVPGQPIEFRTFISYTPPDLSCFSMASDVGNSGAFVPSASDMYENDPNHPGYR